MCVCVHNTLCIKPVFQACAVSFGQDVFQSLPKRSGRTFWMK